MRVLVGIRANSPRVEEITEETNSIKNRMFFHGAFGGRKSRHPYPEKNPSYKRLVSLGVSWDLSMNLLPGCPNRDATFNSDDRERGREVVKNLMFWAENWYVQHKETTDIITLGSQVPQCFDLSDKPVSMVHYSFGRILLLPHPSPLCRFWNDEENFNHAEKMIRKFCHE